MTLLFSGTVFFASPESELQVAPISWDKEARFRLPVSIWRAMMDEYYPNSAWLALRRDVFERVYEFKVKQGIPTWEEAFERLLGERRRGGCSSVNAQTDRRHRRRGPLRRLLAVSLSRLRHQEPAALELSASCIRAPMRGAVRLLRRL